MNAAMVMAGAGRTRIRELVKKASVPSKNLHLILSYRLKTVL